MLRESLQRAKDNVADSIQDLEGFLANLNTLGDSDTLDRLQQLLDEHKSVIYSSDVLRDAEVEIYLRSEASPEDRQRFALALSNLDSRSKIVKAFDSWAGTQSLTTDVGGVTVRTRGYLTPGCRIERKDAMVPISRYEIVCDAAAEEV